MNSILKWLHKNDSMVHMIVMLLVFYGMPIATLSILYPGLVAPLANSALAGVTLIFLLFVSYRVASSVTEWIKGAVISTTLDQMPDLTSAAPKAQKDRIIDLTSPTTMIVENISTETKEAIANLSTVKDASSSPAEVVQPVPVEKKKRTTRSKSVKKEG